MALHPWEWIFVDLIGPLPESGGYNAIMVVVDYFTVRMRELQEVIEMKTNLRKGYCQDLLSTRLTSTRRGRSSDWKGQGFHWNNEMNNLFPSGGEVQGSHQNDGKDNLFPSGGETQGFHQNDGKDNLFPSRGEVQEFHRNDGKDNLFPSRGEVQGFHRNDGKDNLFPSRGEV